MRNAINISIKYDDDVIIKKKISGVKGLKNIMEEVENKLR